jgi:hypothetical protein
MTSTGTEADGIPFAITTSCHRPAARSHGTSTSALTSPVTATPMLEKLKVRRYLTVGGFVALLVSCTSG